MTADILYTYTKAGLSQDIVLREAPLPPDAYGLNDASATLQVYTEFFTTVQPQATAVTNGNIVDDEILDFGDMKMAVGQAFFVNGQDAPVSAGIVTKQWIQITNGTYLVESIPYSLISNQLQQLPHASNVKPGRGSVRRLAFLESNPSRFNGSAREQKPMKLARAETGQRRLKLDYELLSSSTNLTLQGDTTYFVTGTVNITGTTTIEGGTVVKYTNSAGAEIIATNIVCLTGPYSPGVFTCMNDNSVGTVISNSTGSPAQGSASCLDFGNLGYNSLLLRWLRFSYAYYGVTGSLNLLGSNSAEIWDCQFVDCAIAFNGITRLEAFPINFYNVLLSGCGSGMWGNDSYGGYFAVNAVNVTADQVGTFLSGGSANTCEATNCIFTGSGLTGIGTFAYCCTNSTNTEIYTNVGAASYYLTATSTNRNAGTTNINTNLLADLQTLTTYPPVVTNGWFTNDYTFSPQALRNNTGMPDRGYHYPPIDYAVNITVSNATVTVFPGTVLAGFGTNSGAQYGVYLYTNGILDCEGTATSPNYLVQYNTVQEQSTTTWETTVWAGSLRGPNQTNSSWAYFAFTDWSVPAGSGQIASPFSIATCPVGLQDCQFYGGTIGTAGQSLAATNCLFHRVGFTVSDDLSVDSATFYNNLFYVGEVSILHVTNGTFTFRDNFFDQTAVTFISGSSNINVCSNNAYVTTTNGVLLPENNDVILSNSPSFQVGALGPYYYPTNFSPTNLTLIHHGSQPAEDAGLYFYTVTTNEVIEGDNTVSIGFHYVAITNGEPMDTDGLPAVPDYLNDLSGNGILNPFLIFDQNVYPNEPQVRLGYWRFNTTAWTNEAGVGPTTDTNLSQSNSFSGTSVSLINNGSHLAYPVTSDGATYLNLANGTIRFWFQPNWSTGGSSMPTFGEFLFAGNTTSNNLQFAMEKFASNVSTLVWAVTESPYSQPWAFTVGAYNGVPVSFQSNLWYQIVVTYSPTNMALYTNGVLLATATQPTLESNAPMYNVGFGDFCYPSIGPSDPNFYFGNEESQSVPVMGQLDELETFNYPLTAQQVAAGYPYFGGNASNMVDTYYIGISDMLQTNVYGFPQAAATNSIPVRLGYWRFDSPLLYAEQGQMPLSSSNVGVAPSWSDTALVVSNTFSSQITYSDVGSNGWANINCRFGALRFWFKPEFSSSEGPFVYLGSPNGTNEWALELTDDNTISFVTCTNQALPETILSATIAGGLSTSNWTQIVLNYGPTNTALYTNGVLARSSSGNTNWPSLSNRQLGMVIGNNTAYSSAINGQFEEMETFNYQLTASEISSNFQIVANVDSDLDGIPDYLEDIKLTTNRPFLGAPVVITGTIEAEQFDMGGPGIAYSNTFTPSTYSYRPTGMMISSCSDLGGGYCLDQMQSNEWTVYTINVLVPQTYMVDTRVSGITGTGGVFRVEFTNASALFSNSTGSLAVPTTTWTDVTNVVYLTNGIYTMKLHCLTNATGTTNVGRFNYISIYPWWAPPVIPAGTFTVTGLSTVSNYATASNNAVLIQNMVNSAGAAGGGTVLITNNGSFYVAQSIPSETNWAWANAAVYILTTNIAIVGAGTNNTTLIGFNRATTIFSLSQATIGGRLHPAQCTNFVIGNITLEARPNWAVSGVTNSTNIVYDTNWLAPGYPNDQNTNFINGPDTGTTMVLYGVSLANQYSFNILFTNCQFINGYNQVWAGVSGVSNVFIQGCNFLWNSNVFYGNVGFFGYGSNFVLLDNTFNGNTNLAPASFNEVSTNLYYNGTISAVGLAWLQVGGNYFLGRNTILNNLFEGIQVQSGPNSVVGNTYNNLCSDASSCALCATGWGSSPPFVGRSTCFVGNSVYGGKLGQRGENANAPFTLTFSGNSLDLYPTFNATNDSPGTAVAVNYAQRVNICGNTMSNGGCGFIFQGTNGSALILNNNFGSVSYKGIGYLDIGDSLNMAQIFGNSLGQGVNFHAQLAYTNSFGWFMGSNTYVNLNSNSVPLFTDPASSAIHIFN